METMILDWHSEIIFFTQAVILCASPKNPNALWVGVMLARREESSASLLESSAEAFEAAALRASTHSSPSKFGKQCSFVAAVMTV